jgi:hypothetical protein
MTAVAAAALQAARAAGVELSATPNSKIRWRSPSPLPESLRQQILANRAEVLELLRDAELLRLAETNPAEPLTSDSVPDAYIARVIERDLRLPTGSQMLWRAGGGCPGCRYCRKPVPADLPLVEQVLEAPTRPRRGKSDQQKELFPAV